MTVLVRCSPAENVPEKCLYTSDKVDPGLAGQSTKLGNLRKGEVREDYHETGRHFKLLLPPLQSLFFTDHLQWDS